MARLTLRLVVGVALLSGFAAPPARAQTTDAGSTTSAGSGAGSATSAGAGAGAGAGSTTSAYRVLVAAGVLVDRAALVASLRVELGERVESTRDATNASIRVEPAHESRGAVAVLVGVGTATASRNVVELADVPQSRRTRVLALAIAEALHARASVIASSSNDAVPPASTTASAPAAGVSEPTTAVPPVRPAQARVVLPTPRDARSAGGPAATSPPVAIAVFLAGDASLFTAQPTALIGARVGAGVGLLGERLDLRVDGAYLAASASAPSGTVDLRFVTFGASASFASAPRRVVVTLGPRVEVGSAAASARSSEANVRAADASALIVALGLEAGLRVRIVRPLFATALASATMPLESLDLRADGRTAIALAGVAVRGAVGVGVTLF